MSVGRWGATNLLTDDAGHTAVAFFTRLSIESVEDRRRDPDVYLDRILDFSRATSVHARSEGIGTKQSTRTVTMHG